MLSCAPYEIHLFTSLISSHATTSMHDELQARQSRRKRSQIKNHMIDCTASLEDNNLETQGQIYRILLRGLNEVDIF